MPDIRAAFLATARLAADTAARPEVGAAWDGPSALAEFTVRGLAGHLTRGTAAVVDYLDAPEPGPGTHVIDPAAYYRIVSEFGADLADDVHAGIRRRGEDAAAVGHAALVEAFNGQIAILTERLVDEPPTRLVSVFGGAVLHLDDYLVTRVIELTVHLDDLCMSVGIDTPDFPPDAAAVAAHTLVDTARLRHGDAAVLRALTRRERAEADVLHVL
jgi:hypothetical protein